MYASLFCYLVRLYHESYFVAELVILSGGGNVSSNVVVVAVRSGSCWGNVEIGELDTFYLYGERL